MIIKTMDSIDASIVLTIYIYVNICVYIYVNTCIYIFVCIPSDFQKKNAPKARVHILAVSKTSCMSPKTLVGDSMLMDYG